MRARTIAGLLAVTPLLLANQGGCSEEKKQMTTKTALSEDFWIGAGVTIGLAVLFPVVILMRAWVLVILWGWYIVPAFHLDPLRMVFAWGLALVVAFLVPIRTDKNNKKLGEIVANALLSPLIALFVGWVGTFFI